MFMGNDRSTISTMLTVVQGVRLLREIAVA